MSKLSNEKMKNLLALQKVGNFSDLIQKSSAPINQLCTKDAAKEMDSDQINLEKGATLEKDHCEVSNPLADQLRSVSNPLAKPLRSVSNPLAIPLRSVSNPLAIPLRSVSNPLAAPLRSVSNPLADTLQSVSNPLAAPLADLSANSLLNNSKIPSPEKRYSDERIDNFLTLLSGKELTIISYIYFLCKDKGSLVTSPVFSQKLLEIAEVKPNHLRNLISRLTLKRLIITLSFKSSKQASRVFEMPVYVYEKLEKNFSKNLNSNWSQSVSNPLAAPLASDLYVSKYIKPTTYREEEKELSNLPTDWGRVTYSGLDGFDESRLIQVYREYKKNPEVSLSVKIIQDSINHLVFDLQNNNVNFKKPPAVVLTSMLKQGKPYSSITPEKYLSPQESAMAKYNDTQKIINAQRLAIEEDLQKTELTNWLQNMTGDDLLNQFYEPEKLQKIGNNKILKTIAFRDSEKLAKEYFIKEIWQSRKQEILESLSQESVIDTASA